MDRKRASQPFDVGDDASYMAPWWAAVSNISDAEGAEIAALLDVDDEAERERQRQRREQQEADDAGGTEE